MLLNVLNRITHMKIKHQFWLGAGIFLFGLILFVSFVQYSHYQSRRNVEYNLNYIQPAASLLSHLSGDLNIAATKIGFYLVTQEEAHLADYREEIKHFEAEVERISYFPLMQTPENKTRLKKIRDKINGLKQYENNIVELNKEIRNNQPALAYARDNLNPLALNLFQLLNDSVRSEYDTEASKTRKEITRGMYEINQNWLNVTNWVRAFLAFRNAPAVNEIEKYLNLVEAQAGKMQSWGGALTFEEEIALEQILEMLPAYRQHLSKVKALHTGPDWRKDAVLIRQHYAPDIKAINELIDRFAHDLNQELTQNSQQVITDMAYSANINLVVGLAGVLLTVFVMLWAKYRLITPLNEAVRAMRIIAHDGNLSHELEKKHQNEFGDLADSFNEFVTKIKTVVDLVIESSENLVSESEKLSEVTKKSKEQSQLQEDKIKDVADGFNGITATLSDVKERTSDTEKVAREAEAVANEGGRIVDITVNQIQQLATRVNTASETMASLENMSQDIGNIVSIITSITEQTNLLALNAAIEAARAGEAGRGFAVVADEVRSLSNSVTEQTRQIQSQIDSIQTTAAQATGLMQQSKDGAVQCVENAVKAGSALGEIRDVISKVSFNSQSLASASSEQIQKATSVNANIQMIRDIATDTVNGAQQTSAVGYEFKILASQLEGLVSQFLLGIHDNAGNNLDDERNHNTGPDNDSKKTNSSHAEADSDIELF